MYRIFIAILVLMTIAPASASEPASEATPAYYIQNQDIFVQLMPFTIGDFGMKYKPVLDDLHNRTRPELVSIISELVDLYVADKAASNKFFIAHLTERKVITKPEEFAIYKPCYYFESNTGKGEAIDVTIHKHDLLERLSAKHKRPFSDHQLYVMINDLCMKIFTKRMQLQAAQLLEELGIPHFDYLGTSISRFSATQLTDALVVFSAFLAHTSNDFQYRLTFEHHNAEFMKRLHGNRELTLYGIEVEDQVSSVYFTNNPVKHQALTIAALCSCMSALRIHHLYFTDKWLDQYAAAKKVLLPEEGITKPLSSKAKKKKKNKKKAQASDNSIELEIPRWLKKSSQTLVDLFSAHGMGTEQIQAVFSLTNQAVETDFQPGLQEYKTATEARYKELAEKFQELKATHEKLQKEKKALQDQSELVAKQKQDLRTLREENTSLRADNKSLKAGLNQSSQEVERLTRQAEKEASKLGSAESALEQAKSNLAAHKQQSGEEIKTIRTKLKAVQQEAKDQKSAFHAAKKEAEATNKDLQMQASANKSALEKALAEIERLKKEHQTKVLELEGHNIILAKTCQDLRQGAAQTAQERDAALKELMEAKADIVSLGMARDRLRIASSEKDQKIADLVRQLEMEKAAKEVQQILTNPVLTEEKPEDKFFIPTQIESDDE